MERGNRSASLLAIAVVLLLGLPASARATAGDRPWMRDRDLARFTSSLHEAVGERVLKRVRFGKGQIEESAYGLYDDEMEDAFEDLFGDDAFEEDSWCEAEGWVGDGHGETFEPKAVRPRTYYYHPDHLGSTSLVSTQEGAVAESVAYFPYGEVWRDQGRSPTEYRFTSKPYDAETGLMYFGARYYAPGSGRWITADPMLVQPTQRRRSERLCLCGQSAPLCD